jgi:hypothetical protein
VTAEIYRKRGRSVRREGNRLVWVDEAGEAVEDHSLFRTRALDEAVHLPAPHAVAVDEAALVIEAMVAPPLFVERLFISEGIVAHEFGGISWSETSWRVHLSIARPPLRAIFDLANFGFDTVRRAVLALTQAKDERQPPKRIRLREHVGAALLPFVPVEKFQSAAAHDGKGQPIMERRITDEQPPNWFRPSYRVRPRRAWFHQRVVAFGDLDPDVPEALALLAPPGRREIRVLCVDRGVVYPTTVPIRRVVAAKPTVAWYPYGAGAFGAEVML